MSRSGDREGGAQVVQLQQGLDKQSERLANIDDTLATVNTKQSEVLAGVEAGVEALSELQTRAKALQAGMAEAEAEHAALAAAEAALAAQLAAAAAQHGAHAAAASEAWQVRLRAVASLRSWCM
jgi:chromosome segregation ATPase